MFAELKCKSSFSFLRGASDAREYVLRAVELGLPAIAITDVNGVYALPRAFEIARNHPELKLISGAEITIEGGGALTLLAQTRAGYGLLCRLLTEAHADKEKGAAHLTLQQLIQGVASHPGGLGLIAIPELKAETPFELYASIFPERTYVPLCRYLDGLDGERTKLAKRFARELGLKIVATNDPHYHTPLRRPLQDCMVCVREGVTLQTAGFHLFGNDERYLKSPLQMQALFEDLPEALAASLEIAASCTFSLAELKYTYPKEFVPAGHTSQSFLELCVLEGAKRTYRGRISEKVDKQIRHELALVKRLNYADYFLTIFDIVDHARKIGIICQGRGSAANSIICYVLGITSVDPVAAGLLFERFLSDDRAEPPDIDVDFEHERREEVIQYIYERYGRHRAAMVSAVRTYQDKSSFLELSKAIGVAVGTVSADALSRDFAQHAGPLAEKRDIVEHLMSELRGFPRHLSIHSGGFVLSDGPMIEMVPIEHARMDNRTIVQWDKNDLEILGMMKVDILSLGFLTALHKVAKLTGRDWRDIPHDDQPTYRMIQRAETDGTFQIESRAQKSMLVRSLPQVFYDLVVQVSLVRPGPSAGGMVHPYLDRRERARKGEKFVMKDPILQGILGRTYGVPIFQEQVMRLAIEKAGFTAGEADKLRRSLGGWRSSEGITDMGKILYEGLIKEGMSQALAEELFGYFRGFSAYNFPESHGASFASIAYKSAFYKCHYPAEFLCAALNSDPFGFYSIDTLIHEAKRNGVVLHPIDPHRSTWNSQMLPDGSILMGLRQTRKIREADVLVMEAARAERPFRDLKDFIARCKFNRDVIKHLALADAFAVFGVDQRHTFWGSLEFGALFRGDDGVQGSLFAETTPEPLPAEIFEPMRLVEEISADYRNLGYSLRGNIMKGVRLENPELPPLSSAGVKKLKKNQGVRFAGVLTVFQRPPTAKGVAFLTIEDEDGSVDVVVRKDIYEQYCTVIKQNKFLIVEGRVQRQGTGVSVLAEKVFSFGPSKVRKPHQHGSHPREMGRGEWL